MEELRKLASAHTELAGTANHIAMVAIHAVYYNFARIHKTLRITPAMAAGLSDHDWSLDEIVLMTDGYMPESGKRGPYKKREELA